MTPGLEIELHWYTLVGGEHSQHCIIPAPPGCEQTVQRHNMHTNFLYPNFFWHLMEILFEYLTHFCG